MMTARGDRATNGQVVALVALLALAVLLNFVDRGAIGIAAPLMQRDLGLSATRFGIAVSAFFWTYGPLQPVLGALADRWPVARVLALAVALWALSTLATGLATGLAGLIVLRLLLGLGEGLVFPGVARLIAGHVAETRRGLANAVVAVGIALGPALGTLAGGMILAGWGWHAVFVVFGAVTLLWLVPWAFLARVLPATVGPIDRDQRGAWRALLRDRRLWLMGLCHATANYGFFFVSAWLPLYLVKSRGLPIATMALLASATYGAQAVASLGWGQLADRLVRAGHRALTVQRWLCVIAEIGSVAGIAGIALAAGPVALAGALVFTGLFLGCLPTMVYAMGQGLAGPGRAASWIGIQNAIGSLSGIIGPVVTGMIIDATGSFSGAFAFAAAVSGLGAVLFAVALD